MTEEIGLIVGDEVYKPMFHLKPADGAIGTHVLAAKDCGKDFDGLARKIA